MPLCPVNQSLHLLFKQKWKYYLVTAFKWEDVLLFGVLLHNLNGKCFENYIVYPIFSAGYNPITSKSMQWEDYVDNCRFIFLLAYFMYCV